MLILKHLFFIIDLQLREVALLLLVFLYLAGVHLDDSFIRLSTIKSHTFHVATSTQAYQGVIHLVAIDLTGIKLARINLTVVHVHGGLNIVATHTQKIAIHLQPRCIEVAQIQSISIRLCTLSHQVVLLEVQQ